MRLGFCPPPAAPAPGGGTRPPHLLRPERAARPRARSSGSSSRRSAESTTPTARYWSSWHGSTVESSPTPRCPPSFATPSWPPRTRTFSLTPASTTGRCPGWSTRRRRTRVAAWRKNGVGLRLRFPQGGSTLTQQLVRGYFLRDRVSREDGASLLGASLCRRGFSPWPWASRPRTSSSEARGSPPRALARGGDAPALRIAGAGEARDLRPLRQLQLPGQRPLRSCRRLRVLLRQASVELHRGGRRQSRVAGGDHEVAPGLRARCAGDPRPLRRRNEILALMARNGYISESCEARARPSRSSWRRRQPGQDPGAGRDRCRLGRAASSTAPAASGSRISFQGRISVRSTVDERVQTDRERSPGERPRPLREAASSRRTG